ncbi:hypothetical protein HDU96_010569 [Phlyctochytrium bullatum]|nr:hypothetical protein HDU96_010569 [Phlyctochytrium bullatum]
MSARRLSLTSSKSPAGIMPLRGMNPARRHLQTAGCCLPLSRQIASVATSQRPSQHTSQRCYSCGSESVSGGHTSAPGATTSASGAAAPSGASTPHRSSPAPSGSFASTSSTASAGPRRNLFKQHQQRLHQQRLSASTSANVAAGGVRTTAVADAAALKAASLLNVNPHTTGSSFYNNRVLERYAARETKRVTLRQLTVFGRSLNEEKLIRSGNYVREELPVRLAHRIRDFQHLPFIVGTNPHIEELYALYWEAFERFRTFKEIRTLEDNREFCELVEKMLSTHLVAIPKLALGIAEVAPHMSAAAADRFFNEMLRSRIGRRVLAEQHITLSAVFDGREAQEDGWIGIVNTRCRADEVVERCASLAARLFVQSHQGLPADRRCDPPAVTLDGHASALFTYIPDHIEYIVFEILRNSMRFTYEHNFEAAQREARAKNQSNVVLPLIRVTVGASESGITFRVSDQGGGIPRDILENLWSYSQAALHQHRKAAQLLPNTDGSAYSKSLPHLMSLAEGNEPGSHGSVSEQAVSQNQQRRNLEKMPRLLAGKVEESVPEELNLGLGLPMSRVYANYWGGAIAVHSMPGYGTDAYVRIATGNQMENLTYQSGSAAGGLGHSAGGHAEGVSGGGFAMSSGAVGYASAEELAAARAGDAERFIQAS